MGGRKEEELGSEKDLVGRENRVSLDILPRALSWLRCGWKVSGAEVTWLSAREDGKLKSA